MVTTPCIEWTGARVASGYGHRYIKGTGRANARYEYVHRAAWEEANGPIPDGVFVLHRCDNPACYRLDHLFLGTAADNSADMVAKGRHRGNHGHRKTHCKHGHEFTPENTRIRSDGSQVCRTCHREREREARRWALST
jgi:hypothetical protein